MKTKLLLAIFVVLATLTSCVNEWPHPEDKLYAVTLKVHCNTSWLPDYEMTYTRAEGYEVLYQFRIYPAGNITNPVKEFEIYKTDFERNDFTVDVSLNPGSYDVYVWSDICLASNHQSLYYISSDFADITYKEPYMGDSNLKDAFRGSKSFTIDNTMYLHPTATEVIELERPLSRYIFIATDLADFIEKEETRGKMRGLSSRDGGIFNRADEYESILGNYTIRITYPLYMPSDFNNFTDKPFNSWSNVSFDGSFSILSEEQAQVGLDYVMINGEGSSVQVMLEIFDEDGTMISRTSVINVPLLRDRTTLIYGRFLTTLEQGGVTIDPSFNGSFNIEYK